MTQVNQQAMCQGVLYTKAEQESMARRALVLYRDWRGPGDTYCGQSCVATL
jgi:hypothetical protein